MHDASDGRLTRTTNISNIRVLYSKPSFLTVTLKHSNTSDPSLQLERKKFDRKSNQHIRSFITLKRYNKQQHINTLTTF